MLNYMDLIYFLKLYFSGVLILVILIGVNMLCNVFGVSTWYSFLTSQNKINILEGIYLSVLYPLIIGFISYIILKLLIFK